MGRGRAIVLLLVLAVATALRVHALDAEPWFDEVQTHLRDAHRPLGEIATTYGSQNQHVLYSLLARASLALLGDSTAALRAPAVLFGVLGVGALYAFTRAVAPAGHALLAAAVLATSYHHLWFSQNARGYTMLLLFTLVASLLLLRAMARESRRTWLAYAAVATLGAYTHLTMLFVVAGHALVYLRHRATGSTAARRGLAWGFGVALGATALVYAPALPDVLAALATEGRHGLVPAWSTASWALRETTAALSGAFLGWAVAAAALGVAALGVGRAARAHPVVLELLLCPVALAALTLLATGHHFWPRFFFFALGFAIVVLVDGAMALGDALARAVPRLAGRGAAVGAAAVLAVVVVQLASVPRAWGPKQSYRDALALVARGRAPGDEVVVMGPARHVYLAYYRAPWRGAESLAELERIRAAAKRTWLVHSFPVAMAARFPDVQRMLEADFELVARFPGTLGGGVVKVWRSIGEGSRHARAATR